MVDFYAVTGAVDDIGTVYRNLRGIWANSTASHLVEPSMKVLSRVPCSRYKLCRVQSSFVTRI